MILHGHKPAVSGKFHDLYQRIVRARAGNGKPIGHELLTIDVVHLVTMPMSFGNLRSAVALLGATPWDKLGRLGAQSHRTTLVGNRPLIVQQTNDRMASLFVELGGVSIIQSANMAGKFHHGTLQA